MNENTQIVFTTNNSNRFPYGNASEYDKLFQNRNRVSKFDRGRSLVKQEDCKHLELKQNNFQVILEFPKESKNEENIKMEVRGILSCILQEHLSEIS
ncbi:MAG: hypothetical protein HFH42_00970 [Lachnospiraceae bacterium]|jgi:hypothetical protein|nr:hypothetical protein [Lachnospiraceae bacterium]